MENQVIKTEIVEIKQEILEDDDDLEFQFKLSDDDYFKICQDLRAKDDDLIEIEEGLIMCEFEDCKKMFKNKKALAKHKRRKHGKTDEEKKNSDDYSICHLCGKDIRNRSLSLHIKNHEKYDMQEKKLHRCDYCSREFTRALYLRRHMFVHTDDKPFECSWCGKKLRSEYNLKYHMKRHVGVKEFCCDLCGKECSSQQLLDKHHLTHGTNNAFQCNVCLRSYRHQSTLSRHSKMHTHISKCHLCYQTFRYDSHLRKHLLEVHNDVDGISQPRITPEVVKIKKKPATQVESDPNSVDPSAYYTHPVHSTVIVNNVVNFKHHPYSQ